MLLLITIWMAVQAIFGQHMWLLDADFSGGPDAYWEANIGVWYMDWATMTIIVLQLMTDALMVRRVHTYRYVGLLEWFQTYRCLVIWNSYRAIAAPVLLWLATLSERCPLTPSLSLHLSTST